MSDEDRTIVIALITDAAVWVEPTLNITDCRDEKDNKYLELAVAAGAEIVVSSDDERCDAARKLDPAPPPPHSPAHGPGV